MATPQTQRMPATAGSQATKPRTARETMREMRRAPTESLLLAAADIVSQNAKQSICFDSAAEARVPRFEPREVTLGRVLGRGGFCMVQEIEKINIPNSYAESVTTNKSKGSFISRLIKGGGKNKKSTSSLPCPRRDSYADSDIPSTIGPDVDGNGNQVNVKLSRDFVAKKSKKSRKTSGYVLKRVIPELVREDKITYLKGAVDLAMEAKYLSALDHTNIITLAGICSKGVSSTEYFLVLDRLEETLSKRIKTWMNMDRLNKGITGVFTGSKKKAQELYLDRLEAALDIANGVKYLHDRNIVFRDLKPDNIGFDMYGILKIFDFGLAKELRDSEKDWDGLYHMTAMTGAIRYMAPEVGLGKPYNQSVDVYSWAMIMWFIMALEPPFGLYSEKMIIQRCFERGHRPVIFRSWPEFIGDLMKRSWDADIKVRPTFTDISMVLKGELVESGGTCGGSFCSDSVPGLED